MSGIRAKIVVFSGFLLVINFCSALKAQEIFKLRNYCAASCLTAEQQTQAFYKIAGLINDGRGGITVMGWDYGDTPVNPFLRRQWV